MNVRQIVSTNMAPMPQAPYSQAVKINNLVYLSGVLGIDKDTMKMVEGPVEEETKMVMRNLLAILEASNSDPKLLVKVTVFMKNIDDFGAVNEVYKAYVPEPCPARTALQVCQLPFGARVEIEAIALCDTADDLGRFSNTQKSPANPLRQI